MGIITGSHWRIPGELSLHKMMHVQKVCWVSPFVLVLLFILLTLLCASAWAWFWGLSQQRSECRKNGKGVLTPQAPCLPGFWWTMAIAPASESYTTHGSYFTNWYVLAGSRNHFHWIKLNLFPHLPFYWIGRKHMQLSSLGLSRIGIVLFGLQHLTAAVDLQAHMQVRLCPAQQRPL